MQQEKCFEMMKRRMVDILARKQGSLYHDWLDAWRQVVRRVQVQSVGERLRVLWFFSCSIRDVYRLALCRAASLHAQAIAGTIAVAHWHKVVARSALACMLVNQQTH